MDYVCKYVYYTGYLTILHIFLGVTDFGSYILDTPDGCFSCTVCGKVATNRSNLKKHIENIHFPGFNTYTCRICYMQFDTKNKHNHHLSRVHNNAK